MVDTATQPVCFLQSWPTLAIATLLALTPLHAQKPVDFQREIRPILSDKCFHCHGPDKATRMANLRLDAKADATTVRRRGAPIVPGDPAASQIIARIRHTNPALRMPPEHTHKTLTQQEIETLERWIREGADWKEHWAFQTPKRPPLPSVRNPAWVMNPIDQFLLARLEAEGLEPAPATDRRTLIRRATLDLTGLPPKPEEVEAFATAKDPQAYSKLLTKLLASPHYGEHRARYWLDAARYADTHGLHIDNYREMWPYRDWVIKAFNRNIPFNQFVIEQLAGDLLPNRTLDQQVASGFQRCNVTTNEGGVIEAEVQAMYDKDRVDTTATVFLGLTMGCANCHDHKFDPISQKDTYSMAAFFKNTLQRPLDGNIHDTAPVILVPSEADLPRWQALQTEVAQQQRQLAETAPSPAANSWLESSQRRKAQRPLQQHGEFFALQLSPSKAAYTLSASGNKPGKNQPIPSATIEAAEAPAWQAQQPILRFGKQQHFELQPLPQLNIAQPFTLAAWIFLPQSEENFTVASQLIRRTEVKDGEKKETLRGWIVEINGRQPQLRLILDDNKSIQIRGGNTVRLQPGQWHHLTFTYDGAGRRDSLNLFLQGKQAPVEGRGDSQKSLHGDFKVSAPLRLGNDYSKKWFAGGALADLRIYSQLLTEAEVTTLFAWPSLAASRTRTSAELTPAQRQAWTLYFLQNHDAAYQSLRAAYARSWAERETIRHRTPVTHVQQEKLDSQPMARILFRGAYDQPRETVAADTPAVLPPMPAHYPRNRLGLAQWLVDGNNPLTARVTVNRLWQELFGTGLVKTADDFGSQGEPPSHPELLDWLATEFERSGWDIQHMLRLMMTSAAYQQSAQATPAKLRLDPENRLLSRGPRFRMDAEMVRDYALAASGLLRPTVGGPSVKPYQPQNVWETVAMEQSDTRFYKPDSGDALYRRSLYTFWKRSAPPASMDIFNAPTRESCTVRRERTNTPLQALVTMNDPQFIEAARQLAERALGQAAPDFTARLQFLTAHLLGRPFNETERAITQRAYQDYLRHYDSHPADAKLLVATGESRPNPATPVVELAAWTMVTNQLLNLDEVLNK